MNSKKFIYLLATIVLIISTIVVYLIITNPKSKLHLDEILLVSFGCKDEITGFKDPNQKELLEILVTQDYLNFLQIMNSLERPALHLPNFDEKIQERLLYLSEANYIVPREDLRILDYKEIQNAARLGQITKTKFYLWILTNYAIILEDENSSLVVDVKAIIFNRNGEIVFEKNYKRAISDEQIKPGENINLAFIATIENQISPEIFEELIKDFGEH